MAREVGQQVLGHVIAVEQSEHNPLQVLLVNEAILIKICKEEAPARTPQTPVSFWDVLWNPAVPGGLRTWRSVRPGQA